MNDPFLGKRIEGNFVTVPLRDEFLENARLFIFETYCRIHRCIDIRWVFFLTTHYNEMEKYLAIMIKWVHEVLSCFQLGIMSLPVLCILLFDWIIWELDDFGYCC